MEESDRGDYINSRVLEHLGNSSQVKEIGKEENKFVEDKTAKISSDDEVIQIRKEKVIKFLKSNYNWIAYVVLAGIVWMSFKIRTSNLGGLRDITTGTWTLGPDLDPFFFLRLAKYIVANGSLMAIDTMRYVPLGFNMHGEYLLHPYMIAWFHKYLGPLFGTESVTHSAVLYPAFMFALTVIAFFFMTRRIFIETLGTKNANVIALIASFFLSVIPSLLPRTIAGIPEKESAAFLFMFLAFYFFLSAWGSKHRYGRYILAVLAGLSTAGMAHIWGGYIFIFVTISVAVFLAFLLGKVDKTKIIIYSLWILSSLLGMTLVFGRHTFKSYLSSATSSGFAVAVLFMVVVYYIMYETKLRNVSRKYLSRGWLAKIPSRIMSVIVSLVLLVVLASVLFGPSFITSNISNVYDVLIKPATSRLIQTVAENRQPYFVEWVGSFGPYFRGIPVTFWLFLIGSVYMFSKMIKVLKKTDRAVLTSSYILFLVFMMFSRYSSGSVLNGENSISKMMYGAGFIIFVLVFGYYYYQYHKRSEEDILKKVDFGFLLIFVLFFLNIVAARAAVRTIMLLVPSASILVGYFSVALYNDVKKMKAGTMKMIAWVVVVIVIISTLFAGNGFYKAISAQAPNHVPSIYTQQWQRAMAWVRENTPENAVFGHWWDYGYWLQTIGERATVLDGGNAISYWNHLMGRYALTGTDNRKALEFLYAHNTTHFLIDSTDIGKYGAFSSIGSDASYDRQSYIPTLLRDPNQVQEKKNSTVFVYSGGVGLDEDIIYENNGTKLFLPAGQAGLGAIFVERDSSGKIVTQPRGIFVYQGQQHNLPLRYAFDGEFMDFGSGVEAGFFLFPRAIRSSGGIQIDKYGAMLYLSKRTVKSQLARLYLYKEDNPNFELVHSEDDFFVGQIKSQNPDFENDFVQYQGLRGPIRIWEINYPEDIEYKEEFISTIYPKEILSGR